MSYFESLAEQDFQNNLPSRAIKIFERADSTHMLKHPDLYTTPLLLNRIDARRQKNNIGA